MWFGRQQGNWKCGVNEWLIGKPTKHSTSKSEQLFDKYQVVKPWCELCESKSGWMLNVLWETFNSIAISFAPCSKNLHMFWFQNWRSSLMTEGNVLCFSAQCGYPFTQVTWMRRKIMGCAPVLLLYSACSWTEQLWFRNILFCAGKSKYNTSCFCWRVPGMIQRLDWRVFLSILSYILKEKLCWKCSEWLEML